jgi:Cdc6-like AAA superfamily ATPase
LLNKAIWARKNCQKTLLHLRESPYIGPMEIWIKHANLIDFPYVVGKSDSDNIFTFDEQKVNNLVSEIMLASPTCYLVSGYRGAGKTSFIRRVQESCLDQNKQAGEKDKKVLFVYSSFSRFENKTYFLRKLIRDFREAATGWDAKGEEGFGQKLNDLYIQTFNEIKNERATSNEIEKTAELSLESKDFFRKLFTALIPFVAPFISELTLGPFLKLIEWTFFPYLKSLIYLGAMAWGIINAVKVTLTYKLKQTASEKITATSISDDDITEYDLEHLLDTFNREKYKIVFVLDELDKVEEAELDQLLRGMKPWLVRGKADFILVAGQRLTMRYYTLRDRDDELLASLFAKIIHISPMTEQQLFRIYRDKLVLGVVNQKGLATPVPLEQFEQAQATLATSIGNSLIYRSKRIPRSFMNLVRQELQWRDGKAFLPVPAADFRLQETKMRILRKLFESLALNAQVAETARSHISMQLFRAAALIHDSQPIELSFQEVSEYIFNPDNVTLENPKSERAKTEKAIYLYPDLYDVLRSCLQQFYQAALAEHIILRPRLDEPDDLDEEGFSDGQDGQDREEVDPEVAGQFETSWAKDDQALQQFAQNFDTLLQILVKLAKEPMVNFSGDPEKVTLNDLFLDYNTKGILDLPIKNTVLFNQVATFYRNRLGQPKTFADIFEYFQTNDLSFSVLYQQLYRKYTESVLLGIFPEASAYINDRVYDRNTTADYRTTIIKGQAETDMLVDFSYVDGNVSIPAEEIDRSILLLEEFNTRLGKGNYYISVIFYRQNNGWDEVALAASAQYKIEKIRPDLSERIHYIILSISNYAGLRAHITDILGRAAAYSLLPRFDANKYQQLKKPSGSVRSTSTDVNKHQWGGESSVNERKVSAVILAAERTDLFVINIKVTSLSSENPLTGKVTFFLHSSFVPDRVTVFAEDSVAELNGLRAIGPFTIGISCDNDTTKLELDLLDVPTAPPSWS